MTHRPPDRSHLLTEQANPRSRSLHLSSVDECVEMIIDEDRTVASAVDAASAAITRLIHAALPGFVAGGRLIYLGAGTSGRLGVLDASECPPTFCVSPERVVGIIAGGDASLRRSSEGKEDEPHGAVSELQSLRLTPNDTVLGIAAGGTTPFVLGGLQWASSNAESIIGLLTCSPVPQPAFVGHLIVLETGAEIITGSTRMKAGSATKMALNIISTTLMIQSGKVYGNLMVDLRATNDKLRDRAARIVSSITGLPRDAALSLLDHAGGYVKAAVVMHARSVDVHEAMRSLDSAGGRLDRIIQ